MKAVLVAVNCSYAHASLAIPLLQGACAAWAPELGMPAKREFLVRQGAPGIARELASGGWDTALFSCYIFNIEVVREAVRLLRRGAGRAPLVVFGGPEMAGGGADFLLAADGPDFTVTGEGDRSLPLLLRALGGGARGTLAGVPGLAWRDQGAVRTGAEPSPVEPLDGIPSPFAAGLNDATKPFALYEASRGCACRCAFCLSGESGGVREFSLPRVLADLDAIAAQGIPEVRFVDRSFNWNAPRAAAILDHLRCAHPRMRVHVELHPAWLGDAWLLRLLDRPEVHGEIGIQSLDPAVARRVRRAPVPGGAMETIARLCRASRMRTHLDLIAGLPGGTLDGLYADLDALTRAGPGTIQVELLKVLRGTALRREAQTAGIRHDPAAPYTVRGTPDMTAEQVEEAGLLCRLAEMYYNCPALRPVVAAAHAQWPRGSPFWRRLCHWWRARGMPAFGHGLERRFEYLRLFLHDCASSPGEPLGGAAAEAVGAAWAFHRLRWGRLSPRVKVRGARHADGGKLPATAAALARELRAAGEDAVEAAPVRGSWSAWTFASDPRGDPARGLAGPVRAVFVRGDPRRPGAVTRLAVRRVNILLDGGGCVP